MKTISFATPFAIGDEAATGAEIASLPFVQFAAICQRVTARKGAGKIQALLQRARLAEQVTYVTKGGKKFKATEEQVAMLPIAEARQLLAELDSQDGAPGELLSAPEADGISAAIHYRLGTPIAVQPGKEPIAEIEFRAKVFGDVENIIAADDDIARVAEMLESIARPVGGSMLMLPSWAVERISLADGIFIMNKVLPRFLG